MRAAGGRRAGAGRSSEQGGDGATDAGGTEAGRVDGDDLDAHTGQGFCEVAGPCLGSSGPAVVLQAVAAAAAEVEHVVHGDEVDDGEAGTSGKLGEELDGGEPLPF